ncbi:hypothetical protein G5714_014294 [Onychostoma macrolepis]|uniref:Uncharacterized protein n=1 Tax=Onychostoma macrolepis TaxID=369639 RepID=A0A7J6CEB2_9TELE|nr:hypothetical protein G5714_014294 [Onychostoma macrolepis]
MAVVVPEEERRVGPPPIRPRSESPACEERDNLRSGFRVFVQRDNNRDHCFYTAVICSWYHADPQSDTGNTYTPPLPLLASPVTHTGPVKTGGRVFVLEHKRRAH